VVLVEGAVTVSNGQIVMWVWGLAYGGELGYGEMVDREGLVGVGKFFCDELDGTEWYWSVLKRTGRTSTDRYG
jgi:hypothetical protein